MRPATPATRRVLIGAALFNVFAAVTLVLMARLSPSWLGLDPLSPSQFMYVDLFAGVITCFGVAYGLAGHDLTRFWPFIALGTAGKALVVVIVVSYFIAGHTGVLPLSLVVGDALYAFIFLRILRAHTQGDFDE